MKLEFSRQILSKNNFMKISPVGAELFYVDGWTEGLSDWQEDMTKLIIACHNFANTRKSDEYIHALSRQTDILCETFPRPQKVSGIY